MSSEPLPPTAGVIVDRAGRPYRLIALLGQGGFGAVYLAETESLGGLPRRVALKVLHWDLDPKNQAAERMRDEALMLTRLEHPAILAVHDLVEFDGQMGLVTEYIEGADLSDCVDDPDSPLPLPGVLEVGAQVAAALDSAWSRLRIVHRDIKPTNIRVGRHGNVKLLDFGIARSREGARAARTQAEMVIGTVRYLAPERYLPERELDPASDVFALGCVLFEAATGAPLLPTGDPMEAANLAMDRDRYEAWVKERFEPSARPTGEDMATVFVPRIPRDVAALFRKMLAFQAADRCTAAEACVRLEQLRGSMSAGVGLQAWCRARKWPEPEPLPPDAANLEPPPQKPRPPKEPRRAPGPKPAPIPAPEPEPSRSRWRFALWSAFGMVILGLLALGGTLLVVGAIATWVLGSSFGW